MAAKKVAKDVPQRVLDVMNKVDWESPQTRMMLDIVVAQLEENMRTYLPLK
jgi:hypothetical protein